MRIPYTSVTFSARRTKSERVIDLGTPEGARYFSDHHLLHATRPALQAVLASIEADPRPHTLPQSTDDLARNIRERIALMDKYHVSTSAV